MVRAHLTVTNTGPAEGETVVQLYARDEAASVVRPVRQLIAFTRVGLAAGETKSLLLQAPIERLYTKADGDRGIEPGTVTLMAGLSSDDHRSIMTITVGASA